MRIFLTFVLLVGTLGTGARAAEEAVDLELVLAVDVSSSVDRYEAALQREGYIAAISDPAVVQAIRSGPDGRIALIYLEWAGEFYQRAVVDWVVVEDQASAEEFSRVLADQSISSVPSTSISGALDFARKSIAGNRFQGRRAVVDISGDGQNVSGRPAWAARDEAIAAGITINGLPIVFHRNPDGSGPSRGLSQYYRKFVIGGPGAFVIETSEYDSFKATLVAKLVREIRGEIAVSALKGQH